MNFRRSIVFGLAAVAAGLLSCAKNPMGSSAGASGLTNGTTYFATVEELTNDVLFSPLTAGENSTRLPNFGGQITCVWGGESTVGIAASGGVPVYATGPGSATALGKTPPTNDVVLRTPGIGGPNGNFSNDYFIRWAGHKGPDASLDYSSMTMWFAGNQVNYNLSAKGYRGFIFFARGTGNFAVSLSAGNPGDGAAGPYKAYNFYTKKFGKEINTGTWRQITVVFNQMEQLYGAHVDINDILDKAWGLQFDQQPPYTPEFQLDIDYVRFFK